MQPPLAVIAARSERQAMDWSLVLASQGIETAIERSADEGGWQLLVEDAQYERAVGAIRQYLAENRPRRWQSELPWSGLVFDWRSTVWFAVVIALFALSESGRGSLREQGAMDSRLVWAGEWWRLFTAVWLHSDAAHLAANVTMGTMLLGLAMGSFGPGLAVLAAFLAGAGGNLAGLLIYEPYRGLGASGMVMGALGLLGAQSLALLRSGLGARRMVLRGLLGAVMLFSLLGLNPASDVLAHAAGFVTGCLLGGVLVLFPKSPGHKGVNRLAELVCGVLIVVTWWLALRGG